MRFVSRTGVDGCSFSPSSAAVIDSSYLRSPPRAADMFWYTLARSTSCIEPSSTANALRDSASEASNAPRRHRASPRLVCGLDLDGDLATASAQSVSLVRQTALRALVATPSEATMTITA